MVQPRDPDPAEAEDVGAEARPVLPERVRELAMADLVERQLDDEQSDGDRQDAVAEDLDAGQRPYALASAPGSDTISSRSSRRVTRSTR
jgi:hypothetical protein